MWFVSRHDEWSLCSANWISSGRFVYLDLMFKKGKLVFDMGAWRKPILVWNSWRSKKKSYCCWIFLFIVGYCECQSLGHVNFKNKHFIVPVAGWIPVSFGPSGWYRPAANGQALPASCRTSTPEGGWCGPGMAAETQGYLRGTYE